MTKAIAIACSLAACVAVFTSTLASMSREGKPDQLCQLLFEEYVVGRGKINGPTRTAASEIVAERGRNAGFWRDVLLELRKDDEETEMACVRVLGKMLEVDAKARDLIRRAETTGETTAWRPSVEVGNEVIEELIARAGKADRIRVDAYAPLRPARSAHAARLRSLVEARERGTARARSGSTGRALIGARPHGPELIHSLRSPKAHMAVGVRR